MDEAIFTNIEDLYYRFIHNFVQWLSDHGYEIGVIVLIGWLVKRFGTQIVMQLLQKTVRPDLYPTKSDRSKRIKTLNGLIDAVLRVTVLIVGAIMIVAELGLNTTPLIASAGLIGVALGFGAQSLIKDLTSGLFIIAENQYRVGDVIELNDNIAGKVEAISIRTTTLRDLDGTLYHVPNGSITWTANKTMSYGGIDEDIIFPTDTDIEKLAMVINRTGEKLAKHPDYSDKVMSPPHFERVVGFDLNGIVVKIVGTTGSDDSWEIRGAFYKMFVSELRKAQISLPHNKLNVTLLEKPKNKSSS